MKTWPTLLLVISFFLIIIAASGVKHLNEGTVSLALIGLVVGLILEAFHLASTKKW